MSHCYYYIRQMVRGKTVRCDDSVRDAARPGADLAGGLDLEAPVPEVLRHARARRVQLGFGAGGRVPPDRPCVCYVGAAHPAGTFEFLLDPADPSKLLSTVRFSEYNHQNIK